MEHAAYNNSKIITPAFIYDENKVMNTINILSDLREVSHIKMLFAIKSFSLGDGLRLISERLDGFSVSSIFEAMLSRQILSKEKSIHFTTPSILPQDANNIFEMCDYISFNSISQLKQFYTGISYKPSCGIRVNPQISFVKDDKYNPTRKHSKLGVPLSSIENISNMKNMEGIHFHNNCESQSLEHIVQSIDHIENRIPELISKVRWLNLGGGYLIEKIRDYRILIEKALYLRRKYGIELFLELGKGIIGGAGYIISEVVDIFSSDEKRIAILDTTVNHMPEVFEYQFRPDILDEDNNGEYSYLLAGSTCLAGDIFGEYRFKIPLRIGSRIIFEDMGAYTIVKANMFNGINLPNIYKYTTDRNIELIKMFSYEDYKRLCGVI